MANPIQLQQLSTREAATDALTRCVLGLDYNDETLFRSAWLDTDDVVFDMDGNKTVGIDSLCSGMFAFIGPLTTQHMLSNVRVELKDEHAACLTAYALATHYRPDEAMKSDSRALTSGSRYSVDVVKDGGDGLWKIKVWRMQIVWIDGHRAIVGM